jgi:hypothetical protein
MGKSWRSLPNRGLNVAKKEEKTKITQFGVCNNKTYQVDCICVLCRNHTTKMHKEWIALMSIQRKGKKKTLGTRRS